MQNKLIAAAAVLLFLSNQAQAQAQAAVPAAEIVSRPVSASPAAKTASRPAPQWLSFPAHTALRVQLRLLPLQGKQGRDTPISTGYRPELRFADVREGVTCSLTLPPGPGGELQPGHGTEATAQCLDALKLREDRLQFRMYQGGRLVGEGQVLP
ncbi:MAG TPA: hypothetical protein VK195_02865 [Burkholderiaceae bacterium]|nr:hypothetical protein [Burkholderiaceae bacterium]